MDEELAKCSYIIDRRKDIVTQLTRLKNEDVKLRTEFTKLHNKLSKKQRLELFTMYGGKI
jgi:hypothetical protein